MSFKRWDHHESSPVCLSPMDSAADRRAAAVAREAAELDRRQAELVQLRAATASASARIRLWETRYGLALPRNPCHPLLACIVEATRLTLADVHREQHERTVAD